MLFLVPGDATRHKSIMIQVATLKLFRRWRQDFVPSQPADKVWVLMEAIRVVELVEDDALRRQAMITIVLVVFVAVLVDSDTVPTENVIFLLDVELAEASLRRAQLADGAVR